MTSITPSRTCVTCFSNSYEKVRRYSIIVTSVTLVALNALLFISEMDKAIPLIFSRFALLALSFVGLQSLPYWIDYVNKVFEDSRVAYLSDYKTLAFITALKALTTLTSIELIIGSAYAALLGAHGELWRQQELYNQLSTLGLGALGVSFFLLFAYFVLNKMALKEIEEMNPFEITPLQRAIIDKDTLRELLNTPTDINLKEIVEQNIMTQLKYVQGADLLLQLFGFLLLFIEKWFTPDSKASSGINLTISTIWLAKLCREKWMESRQRALLSHLSLEGRV